MISAWQMIKGVCSVCFVKSLNLLYFLSSTEGQLDTKTRWPTHAQRHLAQQQSPLFLLPRGPPNHAQLVQGHKSHYSGMQTMARGGGLHAQCPDFKCLPNCTDCCCQHILFNQADFTAQKPKLQEFIDSHSHLCNFYPKYHCELNFIEQYWGAAKFSYCVAMQSTTLKDMETAVKESLDSVPLLQIRW